MDGSRFDNLARALAAPASRRRLLGRIGGAAIGGLAAALLGVSGAAARCRSEKHSCSKHTHCCSGFCSGKGTKGRHTCAACDSGIVCGNLCCPAETVGCTVLDLPDGPVVGCLCPEDTKYDVATNQCQPCPEPGSRCTDHDQCCGGHCQDNHCCQEPGHTCDADADCCGYAGRCLDGRCRCCAQGRISCADSESKSDVCCEWPQLVNACCDDDSDCTCTWHCCTKGLDCLVGDPNGPFTCPRGTHFGGEFGTTTCWLDPPSP